MMEEGLLTAGHGRTLLAFKNEEDLIKAAKKVAEEGISVRELEKMAKKANEMLEKQESEKPAKAKNHYYEEVRLALNESLGRKVNVSGSKKKGVLTIEFYGEEDLKNLLAELTK